MKVMGEVFFSEEKICFFLLLGGGFKDFLCSPLFGGNDPNFDEYFSKGLKPPTSFFVGFFVVEMIGI